MPPKETVSLDALIGQRVSFKVATLQQPVEGTVFTATPTQVTLIQNVALDRPNVRIINLAFVTEFKILSSKPSESLPLSAKAGVQLPSLQDGPSEKLLKVLSKRVKEAEEKRKYDVRGAASNPSVVSISEVPIQALEGFDQLARVYPGAYWSAEASALTPGAKVGGRSSTSPAPAGGAATLQPVIVVSNQVILSANPTAAAPDATWLKPTCTPIEGSAAATTGDDFANRVTQQWSAALRAAVEASSQAA